MKQRLPYLAPLTVMCIAFILCIMIWPLRIIGQTVYHNDSVEEGITLSAPLSEGIYFDGYFSPTAQNLKEIALKFNTRADGEVHDGVLHFDLYDASEELLFFAQLDCTILKNNDFETFAPPIELLPGVRYHYRIYTGGCNGAAPRLCISSTNVGPAEQQGLFLNGIETGKAAIMKFSYDNRLTLRKSLVYYISILFLAMLFLFAMRGFHIHDKLRKWCIYLCFVAIGTMTILLFDEGMKPLVTPGNELHRNFGAPAYNYTSVHEDAGVSGAFTFTDRYALNKGVYFVGIEYTATAPGCSFSVIDNGQINVSDSLSESETRVVYPIVLEKDCQDLEIVVNYGGAGIFTVYSISLLPGTRFYTDTFYYAFLFILLNIVGVGIYWYQKKHPFDRKAVVCGIILTGVALLSFLPYCNGSLPWADDICYHLLRIEGIKDGIRDGQFPVYIYPEGLEGYGYLNSMYPYLFLYIPAFIRLFCVSIATSYKTLVLLVHLATAYITYASVKSIYPRRLPALLASVLYCLCTYRLTNFYARGAVGEALAMTFFPLLLAGLYHVLTGEKKKWYLLAIGMSGLLQTHILSATLGAILCFISGIVFLAQVIKEKRLLSIVKAIGTVILWNLWYLVPFLYYYKNANFRLSALDFSTYSESSLLLSDLAGTINLDQNRTLTLGLTVLLCGGIAIFHLLTREKTAPSQETSQSQTVSQEFSPVFLKFLLIIGIVCTILLLGQFSAWSFMEMPIFDWFFKKIQFPWRLLGQSSLFFIFAGCISLTESKPLRPYARGILIGLTLFSMLPLTLYHEDQFMYATYTDTVSVGHRSKLIGIPKGENSIVYPFEWRRDGLGNDIIVADSVRIENPDTTTILDYSRKGTTSRITYQANEDDRQIEFPIQYYQGYQATDEIGNPVAIAPSDNQLVGFRTIGDGSPHTITLCFRQPISFKFGVFVSLVSFVGTLVAPGYLSRRKAKSNEEEAKKA